MIATGQARQNTLRNRRRTWFICVLACTAAWFLRNQSLAFAQAADQVNTVKAAEKQSTQPTNPLKVESNLPDTARVYALLMPPRVVAQVFGKRVSEEYAVVEVDIFNLSKDAALMIGDIAVDYSDWIFANCPKEDPDEEEDPEARAKAEHKAERKAARAAKRVGVFLESPACEVSSQELRAVRQIALEGQRGTWRNRVARYLRGLGIAGGALGVANLGKALPATMSAFTNGIIPGFEFAFPDGTIDQINLLNDLAYRVNTVVPQESPRVVMAFFPIRRFLGTYFWKQYLKEPNLFFSPMQYYLDPKFDQFFIHIKERAASFYKEKAKTDLLLAANGPLAPPLLRLPIQQLIDTETDPSSSDEAKNLATRKLSVLAQAAQFASGGSLNDLPVIFQTKAYELVNQLIAANTTNEQQTAGKELLTFAMGLRLLQPLRRISENDPKRLKLEEDINKLEDLLKKGDPAVEEILTKVLTDADAIAPGTKELLAPLKAQIDGVAMEALTFLSQLKFYMAQPVPMGARQNGSDSSTSPLDISDPDFTLNAVHIKVDAKFVTNIDNVAAQIDSLTCEDPDAIFSAANHTTCVIHGHFLDKGTPQVASSDGLDHGLKITAVPKDSTAEILKCELSWTDSIPSGTGLIFTVTKTVGTPAKGQTISNSFTKQVTYPDFTITAVPSSQTVTAGDTSATYTINLTAINGFTDIITLDVSGLPPDVDSSFTPVGSSATSNEARPGSAISLKISPKSSTKAGTYTLIVSGRSKSPAVEAISANKKPTETTSTNKPPAKTSDTGKKPADATGTNKTPTATAGANKKPPTEAAAADKKPTEATGADKPPVADAKDLVRTTKVTLLVNTHAP